ncbi:alpha/beta hydrolase [Chelatococcus reniformis]|uniref:alpha/beta hydrolase n=1 Tax=Chelatococcus reniformis TaxID=1494448 RepID=UPI001FCE40FC|nr:alpha/beta hydrolase [Chelatococcus reniformis]
MLPIEAVRERFEALAAQFTPAADLTFQAVDAGGVPAEWTGPADVATEGVLLYFHGGGYCIGSIPAYREFTGRLAKAGRCRVLSVGYRLAPEHPFPAAVDDAVASYRWLRRQLGPQGSIVLGGDSAGGGLSLALLIALRDAGDRLPDGAFCLSPSTDLAKEGASMTSRAAVDPLITRESTTRFATFYLGEDGDPKHPLASPLYADHRGLPPLLILVGDCERLLDDSTRLAERARQAGVEVDIEVWDEMVHIWPFFASVIPEGAAAIERLAPFIRARLGRSAIG